jgi:hypothetical protein
MTIALIVLGYLLSIFLSWLGIRSYLKLLHYPGMEWVIITFIPIANLIAAAICLSEKFDDQKQIHFTEKFFKL